MASARDGETRWLREFCLVFIAAFTQRISLRWMNQVSENTLDYVMAGYVFDNDVTGIRQFPYSVSKTSNPLTYQSLQAADEVHC